MDPYNTAGDRLPARPPALPPVNPYTAPTARIADAPQYDEWVKASRGARLGAVMLDSLVVFVPVMVAAMILPVFGSGPDGRPSAGGVVFMGLIGLGLMAFVAMQLVMLYRHGQTVGKKLVGIRIVRSDGSRAGLRRILFLRSMVPGLIGAIPLLGPIFSLVDTLYIFGEESRCVHDLIADTIVVES